MTVRCAVAGAPPGCSKVNDSSDASKATENSPPSPRKSVHISTRKLEQERARPPGNRIWSRPSPRQLPTRPSSRALPEDDLPKGSDLPTAQRKLTVSLSWIRRALWRATRRWPSCRSGFHCDLEMISNGPPGLRSLPKLQNDGIFAASTLFRCPARVDIEALRRGCGLLRCVIGRPYRLHGGRRVGLRRWTSAGRGDGDAHPAATIRA